PSASACRKPSWTISRSLKQLPDRSPKTMSACPIERGGRRHMNDRPENSARHAQGMKTRRQVLGDAHVDRAEANKTAFDAPFQELITEAAWAHVWSSDGLAKRERSMLTLALLAGLGNYEELAMHTRATAN